MSKNRRYECGGGRGCSTDDDLRSGRSQERKQGERGKTMGDQDIRAAIDRHWAASAAGDLGTEHDIYHDDAICDYPQSGERTRGRLNIQALRGHHPDKPAGFEVRRVLGSGDLWITECIITYQGKPAFTVSIMEFRDGKVAHDTQYFADPFEAPGWRSQWVERMK